MIILLIYNNISGPPNLLLDKRNSIDEFSIKVLVLVKSFNYE